MADRPGAAADVSLADPTISRRHAELDFSAHRIMLTPIGTVLANGVPINAGPLLAGLVLSPSCVESSCTLTLLTPVLLIGTTLDERRSGRRARRREISAFRSMLDERT